MITAHSSRNRLRRTAAAAAVGALLLIATAACSSGAPSTAAGANVAAAAAPLKVGVLVGLTGSYAALGSVQRDAIQLYFDDINESGGIDGQQVELTVLDTASEPATAINQLRQLAVQDEVDIVLGPSSSSEAIALKPFAASLKIPVLSLASAESIVTPASEATYIFKAYTDTKLALEAQMELLKERDWTKVALLSVNNGYGQEAALGIDAFITEYKFDLVANEVFDATATDVTAQLTKIGESDPDVVLVWAVNPANAVVAKTAAAMDFKPVLFHSAGAGAPSYISTAGAAGEGTLLQGSKVLAAGSMATDDSQYAVTQNFVEKYTAKYSEAPGQYAASAWDASLLLSNAVTTMTADGTDLQALRDGLRDSLENNTKGLIGVNGVFTFTPEFHGPTGLTGLAVLQVKDGAFQIDKAY